MSNFIQYAKDSNISFQHGSKKCCGLKSNLALKQTEDQRDDDDLDDYRSTVWEECDYDNSVYTTSSLQILNQSHSYQMKLLQQLKKLKPKKRVKKKNPAFDKVPLIHSSPSSNSSDGWKYLTVQRNERDGNNEDSNTHDF